MITPVLQMEKWRLSLTVMVTGEAKAESSFIGSQGLHHFMAQHIPKQTTSEYTT